MGSTGQIIKDLRGNKSQHEFAREIEVSQGYLCLLEADKRSPSKNLIRKLAKKYNLPIEKFM